MADPHAAVADPHAVDAAGHGADAAAHGAEAGGAFPPFDAALFSSQLIWFALTFVGLYFVIARFVIPKVGGVQAKRAGAIESDLSEAAQKSAAADEARATMEKAVAKARRNDGVAERMIAAIPLLYCTYVQYVNSARSFSAASSTCVAARIAAFSLSDCYNAGCGESWLLRIDVSFFALATNEKRIGGFAERNELLKSAL